MNSEVMKNEKHIRGERALFDDSHLKDNGVHAWQFAFRI